MRDSDWEILNELYKNPNMTKVANLLFVSQPTLTKRIQYMEAQFDVTLINRSPKGISFTAEGEILAKQAQKHIQLMAETKKQLDSLKKKKEEVITIASSYTYSKYVLPELIYNYTAKHPHVRFEIVTDSSNILFQKVVAREVDMGFIKGDYHGAVNQVLVEKNEASLITKEPINFDDLPQMRRIGYKTNDRSKELLDHWWHSRFSEEALQGITVEYVDHAWQLIHKGLGYTYCFLPTDFQNEYNLHITPLENADGSKVTRNTWFVYPLSKTPTNTLQTFIDYVISFSEEGVE